MSVLYRSDAPRAAAWAQYFAEAAPDLDFRVWPDAGDLDEVEYLIAWQAPATFLASLPNLKVLFSSGAGIDHIVFITPHVASMTQPETAAPVLLENLRRHQRGEPLSDLIDRSKGY